MESKDHMGLTKLDRLTPLSIIKEKKGVPSQNKTKKKKKRMHMHNDKPDMGCIKNKLRRNPFFYAAQALGLDQNRQKLSLVKG